MAANKENTDIVDGSEGETKSVNARKIKVKKTLSSLDMNVTESCDPPVIAVLGSGGGLRAMVGLMGTISKLAELNILGAATYMAGISGSTWCISSLYSKKNWSDFSVIKDLENQLRERIKQETQRKHPWEKIKEKFLEELYSLTDLWAYTFVFEALNTVNKGKLSSHKEMCETGEDPYPVYSAVRKSLIHENKSGLWGSAPGADWIKLFIHDMYCKFIQWLTGEMSKDLQLQGFWWSDIIRVMKNIGFCLLEWEWGTTNNFLYQCKDKIPEDCDLFQKKYIHLIDAGLEINTPYPLVLHPHRKVDLIMSFDFSQDGPFETVKKTAEYCKEHKIPFPEINEESFEDPPTKSCYIFKGDGNETPDVMHFPLFNTQTCGDAEKIKESIIEYDTKVLLYDGPKIDTLLNITKKNVESSLKQILDQIKECVQRCNKKGMS
ncbi:cytosolic phospholipase A2 gamma-like isoform X4 [Aquarana catesbeiana]|uniref:cytosolic phospholipase A2 gamma-like isoform X4 n=1 Tax=Aquarana catesbeiana TaxID=8400 RepID=UPI003CC94DCD